MKERKRKNLVSGLAALLLLGVFAAGILAVLLSGADAYRRITLRDRLSYDSRTCTQYIATKVRQAPSPDSISFSSFGDGDAIFIRQSIDGAPYLTRIYCHDGWLMELFTTDAEGFEPGDGEPLMPLQSLVLHRDEDLLSFQIIDGNGSESTFLLCLRGEKEAAS